nr:MAG TPA_asm: circumsporozoite-related antigen [Bacteriophage sp.]
MHKRATDYSLFLHICFLIIFCHLSHMFCNSISRNM